MPNRAAAHYAYGQVCSAAANLARAAQAFANAIKLMPGFADAWTNLGLTRYYQGAVGDAKTCFANALKAAPGHPTATANLAALLRLTGIYQASELLLTEALARNPANAAARLNIFAQYLPEGRHADALALLNIRHTAPPDYRTSPAVRATAPR